MKNKAGIQFSCLTLLLILSLLIKPFWLAAREKDSCKLELNVAAEVVSSYLWRGLVGDLSPNIQPSLSLAYGQFELGLWGSSNFHGTYREVDSWLSYSWKSLTFTVNDYFYTPNDTLRFFEYNYDKTGHLIEGMLGWDGPASFPLKLSVATFFMGPDNEFDYYDTTSKIAYYRNNYSTYLEVRYPFSVKQTECEAFLGGTPMEGYYGSSPGIINLGIRASRKLKITEHYTLPVNGSLILNPQHGAAYFVIGLEI
ncbi:MAG TPA: hypothetical protein P5531_10150 [Bacteroidales bacterium]|nr:hypothetical protein [Bacteroidales bacterium]HSA44000.1 hypothetical protein [Bacteroidales bacterium]